MRRRNRGVATVLKEIIAMDILKDLLRRARQGTVALLVLASIALAQQPAPQPTPPPKPGVQQPAKPPAQKPAQPEKRITPEQAKELFESVDAILKFASEDTRLPIRGPVKRELMNRRQLHDYIIKKMDEDPDTQRFLRAEAVLKKFGLLPLDFHLRPFMISLLDEQVAAFYEPKTKTVYLLDWVEPEGQEAVLAHELTHALQDQNFDLEKWSEVVPDSPDRLKKPPDPNHIEPDEERAAREAVSEGQAMVVLVDYMLAPRGISLAEAPYMAEPFKQQTLESSKDSPVLNSAPLYVRESLVFAYTFGLGFVQKLLETGGRQLAFDAALRVPPADTREIMDPQVYMDREKLPPLPFPPIVPVVQRKYTSYDTGVVGAFDVYVMLKQFSGEKIADELATKWRGGLYWVVEKPGYKATPDQTVRTDQLALFYLSRWASSQDASRFAEQYRSWLPKRYKRAQRDTASDAKDDFARRVASHSRWDTEDGPAYVEAWGDYVLVMEGLDDQTAASVRDIVLEKEMPEPQPASTPIPDAKPLRVPAR